MSQFHELRLDELEQVSGGGTTKLFSEVHLGSEPSHNYGMISDSFKAPDYQSANSLLQHFNAPTYNGLYGPGNDPGATTGTIARPGAQELHGVYLPNGTPADSGGNVTLQHGDGYAVNTTIPWEHPLEGTISRNLVTDFHEGGGYQVLTLGQGHGGSQLATGVGTVVGSEVGGALGGKAGEVLGGMVGGDTAQNASHLMNPELGAIAFSQLDNAMLAHANGTNNPNLDLPSGPAIEAYYAAHALASGVQTELGLSPVAHDNNVQHDVLYGLAHDLNSQGPVTGSFAPSANNVGVYHFTPDGSKYYEMQDGHVVEKPVDEMSGVDHAIELDAQHVSHFSDGPSQLPDPPAPIIGLPPELTPHDGNTPSGPDHTENVGSTQFADTGHTNGDTGAGVIAVDPGNHPADTGNHSTDVTVASIDPAPVTPAPAITVDTAPVAPIDIAPVAPIAVFDPGPIIAPIQIPVFDTPAPITGAYTDINPIPVVAPVDPGINTSVAGIGILDVGAGNYGMGSSYDVAGGFDAGSYDTGGGFDTGGFGGSFDA